MRRSADRVEGLIGLVCGRTAGVSVSGRAAFGVRFWVRGPSFGAGVTRLGRGRCRVRSRTVLCRRRSERSGWLPGVGIGEAVYQPQSVDHAPGRGELDPCDCVVPALFRRSMPGTRALRGGRQRRRLAESCRRWPCIRRGELPDLVRPGGRGSESRRVLFDRLRPLSLAVSTQRQSVAAMVCSAVDGQILRFGVPRPGPCHGPQTGACRCGRVSASAARWFHGVPGPFTSRRSRARACRLRQVRFGKVKQFAEPSRPAFSRWSGLPRGL